MEPLPCPRHPAGAVVGGGERGEVTAPRALPPRAARLALHARGVAERLADGDLAVADLAQMGPTARSLEVEQARPPACMTRTAVIVLVIDPMRYWPSSPGASPAPPAHTAP